MPQGNPFRGSNRYRSGSNTRTTLNQGGGSKKAGFPYQIGRTYGTSIALDMTDPVAGHCCQLKFFQMNMFPNAHQSRPIGSAYSSNRHYYHIPGVGY